MRYCGFMATDRLTVTVNSELAKELRRIAKNDGMSVSGWVSEAIEHRVRNYLLGKALDEWEAEAGPFPEDDLIEADKLLDEAEAIGRAARAERTAERLAG